MRPEYARTATTASSAFNGAGSGDGRHDPRGPATMTRYIVLSCVLALATWPVHAAEELRSFDRNRDGRIDQWEYFAAGSQEPYKVERDTNGDGKADAVREKRNTPTRNRR
jgi:hypothetical protein